MKGEEGAWGFPGEFPAPPSIPPDAKLLALSALINNPRAVIIGRGCRVSVKSYQVCARLCQMRMHAGEVGNKEE